MFFLSFISLSMQNRVSFDSDPNKGETNGISMLFVRVKCVEEQSCIVVSLVIAKKVNSDNTALMVSL
jgi:hypothetical protein